MLMLARNRAGTLQGALLAAAARRQLSSRASAVLSALDIPTTGQELDGVYDGEWKGSGKVLESVCPTTGEVLARVKSVRAPHDDGRRGCRIYVDGVLTVRIASRRGRLRRKSCTTRWARRVRRTHTSGTSPLPSEAR